jgi:hypothetical protein
MVTITASNEEGPFSWSGRNRLCDFRNGLKLRRTQYEVEASFGDAAFCAKRAYDRIGLNVSVGS